MYFFICQNLSSVSDYPLKLSNVSQMEFFLQRHGPGKQQRHVHNMHKATFGTWRDNLCSSESSEEKYTFCVCLKNHFVINIIWSKKVNRIQILFGLKNHPKTNTNIIRFEKFTRIRIRILFGLKKSPEYEYEYYSV